MYVTVAQVRAHFDKPMLLALFSDGAGEVADGNEALQLVMLQAHAEMTSELAPAYGDLGMPDEAPAPVSAFLVTAELAYIKQFAFERRPAVAMKIGQTYLEDLRKTARERMDRLKHAIQEIAPNDNPPATAPANVGGITTDQSPRMISDPRFGLGRSDFGPY